MKKLLLIVTVFIMPLTTALCGEPVSQSISFDDGNGAGNAGTYGPNDSFGIDLYLTYSGYNSSGFSLWFETAAASAPFITLTGFTYGTTFFDPNQGFSGPLGFTLDHGNGFFGTPNPSDLGATVDPPYDQTAVPPGTYFVGHLTVSLAGLAPGVYTLRTDATNPHQSEVSNWTGGDPLAVDEFIPNADYTITVIPEPGTVALFAMGAVGVLGAAVKRRRA